MLKLTFTFSIRPVIGVTIKSEDYRTSLIFIMGKIPASKHIQYFSHHYKVHFNFT